VKAGHASVLKSGSNFGATRVPHWAAWERDEQCVSCS